MFELLTELLGYARKLLPLMELYAGRRQAQPVRDSATQEFQSYTAEVLRANRADLMEIRSTLEAVQQRLRVVDDQSAALQRELARLADQHRTVLLLVVMAFISSLAGLITGIVAIVRH